MSILPVTNGTEVLDKKWYLRSNSLRWITLLLMIKYYTKSLELEDFRTVHAAYNSWYMNKSSDTYPHNAFRNVKIQKYPTLECNKLTW
jgi:hypothetical protein